MNAEDGNGSRRCPGEFVSPGFLVLCLLFLLLGNARVADLFSEEQAFRTASAEASFSGVGQPLLRILYAANSRGALHPCPS